MSRGKGSSVKKMQPKLQTTAETLLFFLRQLQGFKEVIFLLLFYFILFFREEAIAPVI